MVDWAQKFRTGGWLATGLVIAEAESRFQLFSQVPMNVYYGIAAILVAGSAVNTVTQRVDGSVLFFGGFISFTAVSTITLLNHPNWPEFAGLELFLALGVSAILWYLAMCALTVVAMSILGVDPSEQNADDTDDPYGDQHAARLLQDNL